MRELKFIITGQSIQMDPSCDFSCLASGTKGYLKAVFTFNEEWRGCAKIAEFRKHASSEPSSERLVKDACIIPEQALTGDKFYVSVIGIKPGYRIKTNKLGVRQDG